MLDMGEVSAIAREVASANLSPVIVKNVSSAPDVDWDGAEALRIMIVIDVGDDWEPNGEKILDTLVGTLDRLQAAGEHRFPHIGYATPADLSAHDDPET